MGEEEGEGWDRKKEKGMEGEREGEDEGGRGRWRVSEGGGEGEVQGVGWDRKREKDSE